MLLAGVASKGKGGYLQWDKIGYSDATNVFVIKGAALNESKTYHCATNDFLFSGKETNFDFFNAQNTAISNIDIPKESSDLRSDIRKAFIAYLKNNK